MVLGLDAWQCCGCFLCLLAWDRGWIFTVKDGCVHLLLSVVLFADWLWD
ncbi:hypothetical protein LEMLEM_LOCUS15261 [Lemmus lemmus]